MKAKRIKQSLHALAFIEVIMALAVLAAIVAVILPRLARSHIHTPEMSCRWNLKDIGLSFRIWANDHNDLYPMQVDEDEGGARQAVADKNLVRVFQVMSNELSIPKSVICAADRRLAAKAWPNLHASNLSYFVGLDSVDTKPNMILSGDRDIAENGQLLSGTANLTTNLPVAWHRLLHKEGGNLLFADGSVQQTDTAKLRELLAQTGDVTNRVLFPQ